MKTLTKTDIQRMVGTRSTGGVSTTGGGGGGGTNISVEEVVDPTGSNAYTSFEYENGVLKLKKTLQLVDCGNTTQTIGGNKTFSNTVIASEFQGPSDARLKNVLDEIELTVEQIAEAPSVLFTWKDKRDELTHGGTIAQYWLHEAPWAVREQQDGTLTVGSSQLALAASIAIARELVKIKQIINELKNHDKDTE